MNLNSYLKIAVFFLFPLLSLSQTRNLTGKTQDSLQNPIPNTNMTATPIMDEDVNITSATFSLVGEYKLKLQDIASYQIAITHLGFKKVTNTSNKIPKTFIFGNETTLQKNMILNF